MTVAAVLGLDAPASLRDFPVAVDRVVACFQLSPRRRRALAERFPGAEILETWPGAPGPWQATVEADLASLARGDVEVEGVPLADALRAPWREEIAAVRGLAHALRDARRVVVQRGTASAALVRGGRERGAPHDLVEVGPRAAPARERPGLVSRVRRAGARGVALALASRLDPSHARRSRLRLAPGLRSAPTLLTASYVNPARAALEAWAHLGGGPAVLLRTGPGAAAGLALPGGVRSLALSSALALARGEARAARASALPRLRDRLDAVRADPDPYGPGLVLRATRFGRALLDVHAPEAISAAVAVRALVERTGAKRLVVGDEFAVCDRSCVHAARALGIETVSRQHGVLDSHYLRDAVLCDRHLAWDEATADWLRARGAAGTRRIEVAPRPAPAPTARRAGPRCVAVFLQPLEMIHVHTGDWLAETLPAVVAFARERGLSTVLKAHPLQTAASVRGALPADLRAAVRLASGETAREVLADTAVAVTLDSSVCVDCREAGVPCLSTAWLAGTYAAEIARLGWVVPCATPEALAGALRAAVPLP